MAKKNQHVVPNGDRWSVRGAGNSKVTKSFDTQKQATDHARTIARNQGTELFIHRPNGQIRDRDSYGNDPHPPKG